MYLLTALIVRNGHILARIYFIFLKKLPRLNLKGFQYQIWTSVAKLGKKLSSKTNIGTLLKINCSDFRLKLGERS